MKLTIKRLSLAIASVGMLTLYGCGGGGESTPAQLEVSGVVAKGPATGAKVKIYAVTNGVQGALLGEGTTTAGGSYKFNISKPSGPILIKADLTGADIVDENATVAGTTYKGKSGDVLLATVATLSTSGTQDINVTPFSHMAAAYALAKGLTPENILAANAVVRQILNNTDFLTASPTETNGLLVQLSQLSKQAVSGSGENTIQTLLTALATVLVVNADGNVTVSNNFATTLCGTDNDCKDDFAATVTPVKPTADLGDVEKAKALFQNLFDTVSALVNNTATGDLDKAGQKLKTAASQAVAFVDTDQLDLIGLATDEIGLLELYKTTDSTTTTVSNYSGTCEVAALTGVGTDGSFTGTTEITTTNANALICGSKNQQSANPTTADTIPYASRLRNQIILIQADNGYSNFKYVSRVRGAATEGDTSRRFNLGSSKYGTFTRSETSTQTVASFVGQLAPSIVQFGVAERDNYLHNDINLSLTLQGTVSTPTLSFSPNGFIKLVKSDNTVASTLNIVSGTANSTSGSLNVNGTAPGLKIEGILSASNVNEIAGTGAVNFTGSIYESTTNLGTDYRKLLEGRVTYNKTGSEVGTVKFVGELTVNQRKPVGVTLDVDLYGGLDGVSETSAATFYWDGNSFSLKDTGAGLVVTNSNGVKFTYVRGSASDIFVGSVNVGTIDANRRVSLKDGTFIQF